MNNPRIVLVEDDAICATLILKTLKQYQISHCSCPEKFRELITEVDPDLIIMDIELGDGESGYELCEWYRQNHTKAQILFMSAHDDFDKITKAYDSGGNDFILKPVNINELRAKLALASNKSKEEASRKDEENTIRKMAFDAMCETGYIGRLLTLSRDVAEQNDIEKIIDAALTLTDEYNIDITIKVKCGDTFLIKTSNRKPASPIELSIMEHLNSIGRLFQFKNKLIINFMNCVILVKNMPKEDDVRSGWIRDHIAIVSEIVDSRLRTLEKDTILGIKSDMLNTAKVVLQKIESSVLHQKAFSEEQRNTISSVQSEIGKIIHELYLSGPDERKLLNTITTKADFLLHLHDASLKKHAEIHSLSKELILLLNKHTH